MTRCQSMPRLPRHPFHIRYDIPGRWRRQEPIGRYICDFVSYRFRLVVELDGEQHLDSVHDQRRDAFLSSQGFAVLRFWNHEIYRELDDVLEAIFFAAQERSQ